MDSSDNVKSSSDYICVNSWLELSKSDYAKVIFCDLYHHSDSSVGCRFQITDNVHEDPGDFVGLFRVGYDNLSQCLVSKMLSQTECEEDGKLLRCVFKKEELPELEDGFYQFLYVTRDKEVCGASMPFEIKQSVNKEDSSDEDVVADRTEDDFLVVRSNMVEKNRMIQTLLCKYRSRNLSLSGELEKVIDEKKKACEEKEVIIANLNREISRLKRENFIYENSCTMLKEQLEALSKKCREEVDLKSSLLIEKKNLAENVEQLQKIIKERDAALLQQKSAVDNDKSLLLEQIEDLNAMIRALEDSKELTLNQVVNLSDVTFEQTKFLNELKCENLALKLKLDDELRNSAKVLKLQKGLEKKIKEKTSLLKQPPALVVSSSPEKVEESKVSKEGTKEAIKDVHKREAMKDVCKCEAMKDVHKCEALKDVHICELESAKVLDSAETVCKETSEIEPSDEATKLKISKLESALVNQYSEVENIAVQLSDVSSKCMQWEEEVSDLKTLCAELRENLSEKESCISKLQQDCIKKGAVIEYLTNEKSQLQKNEASLYIALNESSVRLQDAAELYKKQFMEIEKLKKKLRKSKQLVMQKTKEDSSLQVSTTSTCCSDSGSSVSRNTMDTDFSVARAVKPTFMRSSSDSDTGEHFFGNAAPVQLEKHIQRRNACAPLKVRGPANKFASLEWAEQFGEFNEKVAENVAKCLAEASEAAKKDAAQGRAARESPDLHIMIEQNLANLTASKARDQNGATEVSYTIPCFICEKALSITTNHTEAIVKHLEFDHKQQMCPICGRLFDMNLPQKYLIYHVDDHFKFDKSK